MSSYDLQASEERSSSFIDIALDEHPEQTKGKPLMIIPRQRFYIVVGVICALVLALFISTCVLSSAKSQLTDKVVELRDTLQHLQHQPSTTPRTTKLPTTTGGRSTSSSNPGTTSSPRWTKTLGDLTLNENFEFSIKAENKDSLHWVSMSPSVALGNGVDCSDDTDTHICMRWTDQLQLNISRFVRNITSSDSELECYTVEWDALHSVDQLLTDCFDVSESYWYGGYEDFYQYWPFNNNTMPLSPYVTNDAFTGGIGNVIDSYFISSRGQGLLIGTDVPLYFSLNNPQRGKMCFTAKYETSPYFNVDKNFPRLNYTICQDDTAVSVRQKMVESFIGSPPSVPNTSLFQYPIWSTWAQYHKEINQDIVINFTNDIIEHKFNCSQIEVDDNWTPFYGDFEFDTTRFPNVSDMVRQIHNQSCAVTVWVHPFFNSDGEYFKIAQNNSYLLRNISNDSLAALTKWWDGNSTGVLDVSNPDARRWYLDILQRLKNDTGIDSFKFDAGELSWLPEQYTAAELPANPNINYPGRYVNMASSSLVDTTLRQEVRSGYRNQHNPVFVRQIDKLSSWDHANGLRSIIPGVLTFSILGYPFVLPDMIGGNAYDGRFPSSELFVRWVQLNTFLPAMQFSIVPWDPRFNDSSIDVVDISRRYTQLHTEILGDLLTVAMESTVTSNPIIRPVWWIDPTNDTALTCEDQFLVGDIYLVAPILYEGARSRDIYVPSGHWVDILRGGSVIQGPVILYNYTVQIDELAYFKNQKHM